MKKIISMLAVLCMLITSMPMIVTADEIADEVTGFTAEDRVVYVNKDATRYNKKLQSNDTTVNNGDLWADGIQNNTYNKKTASNGTEYLQFEPESENWVGANNQAGQPIKGKIYNQKKLTVETWISIDDISQAFVNIFATTKSHYNVASNGMWQLYVENSKLKHKYNSTIVTETDLTELEGKFMHLVITRDVRDDKIVLETIINGVLQGTKEVTDATLLENPDGDLNTTDTAIWFFGGYRCGNASTKLMNFSGRVGEMNVYHNVMNTTQASTLYNRDKDKYNFAPEKGYAFKKNEVFYQNIQNGVNDASHGDSWMVVNRESNWVTGWNTGTVNRKNATGTNGRSFSYFDYEPLPSVTPRYFGSNNPSEKTKKVIRNQPETTVEFWLSVDDLLLGDVSSKETIFFTGTSYMYSTDAVKWHIYVQDGKIKQAYDKGAVANEIDITKLGGQFINLVATRKVDSNANTITYDLYVNGNKAETYVRSNLDSSVIAEPDGTNSSNDSAWFVGGIWEKSQLFVGKIARFNVYNKIADEETVKALYNEEKNTYNIGVDTDRISQADILRSDYAVKLNKNGPTSKRYFTINGAALTDSESGRKTWTEGTNIVSKGTNASGKEISYYDYTEVYDKHHIIYGDNATTDLFINKILNKDQMTVETWLSVDDIMAGRVDNYRNIFYFGKSGGHNSGGSVGIWSMFVSNGQLRQTYESGETACTDIPLADYVGKFIHIVATRNIERTDDGTISKITYQTYFNGKAQTPVVLEAKEADENGKNGVTLSVSTEALVGFGGIYQKADSNFLGKVAEFNFFNKIMSGEDAKSIYEAEKGKYTLTEKTAEEEYADFKNAKALYLNKGDIITVENSGSNYLKIPKDITSWSNKEWMWASGMKGVQTGVNKNGGTYTYYPFTADTRSLLCSNNDNKIIHDVINGRKKLSIEMWIAVDDIMNAGETGYRTIFGTGSHELSNRIWNFVVKGGKLVNSYKNEVIDEIDITGYKSEFVHVVLTRDVDDENNTISFNTYFNGEKQTGKDITVTETDIANIDNNCWIFGDTWSSDNNNRFVGKIADIVVYQDVLPTENAATLYNETKDTYASKHVIKVEETAVYCNDDEETSISKLNDILDLDCTQLQVYYKLVNTSARYTKHAMVTLALYDGNKLVDVVTGNVTLAPGKSTENLNDSDLPVLTITLPQKDGKVNLSEKSQLKFFVWSTDEGENMQPYEVDDSVDMEWKYLTEEGL